MDARHKAETHPLRLHQNWFVAVLIFLMWLGLLEWLAHILVQQYGPDDLKMYEWALLSSTAAVACIIFLSWMVCQLRHEHQSSTESQDSTFGRAAHLRRAAVTAAC